MTAIEKYGQGEKRRRCGVALCVTLIALCGGPVAANGLPAPGLLTWSQVDVSAASGRIQAISGDNLGMVVFDTDGDQLWQRSASAETWSRMTSYDDFLVASELFNEGRPGSMSAAGNYVFVGGEDPRNRFAYFDGSDWFESEWTGSNEGMIASFSYVATSANGATQPGDVVTVMMRGSGRVTRAVDGVLAESPASGVRTPISPDGGNYHYRAVTGLPDEHLVWGVTRNGYVSVSDGSGRDGTWAWTTGRFDTDREGRSIHAIDEDTLVVGTTASGGTSHVYLTADGGATWSALTDNNFSLTINAIWADSASNVYAAPTGSGVYHYDGSSWSAVADIASNDDIRAIHHLDGRLWFGGADSGGNTILYTAIPEPGTAALLLLGLAALARLRGKIRP